MNELLMINIFLLLIKDNEKRTPLHAAAYFGDAEIIELLILSGMKFFVYRYFGQILYTENLFYKSLQM